jgi:hypothetical protein
MAKGDVLKAALNDSRRAPHQIAVIRSAIYKEMERFTALGSLPASLNAGEICRFLAPIDRHLSLDDVDQLHKFADFLAVVDLNPSARPGYRLVDDKLAADLGL